MLRMLFIWLAFTGAFAIGIMQVRHMTGQELWSATKTLLFGMSCATLALVFLIAIVILF